MTIPVKLKNLDFNAKNIILKNHIYDYDNFYNQYFEEFTNKLKNALRVENKKITLKEFIEVAKVVFYNGFWNAIKEQQLANYLNKNNFKSWVVFGELDYIFKIDVMAQRNNKNYFIQLKSSGTTLKLETLKSFYNLATKKGALPVVASWAKKAPYWEFYELKGFAGHYWLQKLEKFPN